MDLIKKLNNISVNDLKNIDVSRSKEWLQSQPGLMINSLLIIITIVVVSSAYSKSRESTKLLQKEYAQLKEKLEILDGFNTAEKQYKSFTKNIPQTIDKDGLITVLSEFAIARNIRILSFSPTKEESSKFANVTSVEINVASEDYASLILFMHDIESSSYLIRIGKWFGVFVTSDSIEQQRSRRSQRIIQQDVDGVPAKKLIKATIKIESVELKNV